MADWRVARLDEIEESTDGRAPWRPVRHELGIRSFGVNAWTGHAAGDRIINEHDEGGPDDPEELYVVVQGRARFELDGETVDAPAGTLVFVPPGIMRTAFAEEPETAILEGYGEILVDSARDLPERTMISIRRRAVRRPSPVVAYCA